MLLYLRKVVFHGRNTTTWISYSQISLYHFIKPIVSSTCIGGCNGSVDIALSWLAKFNDSFDITWLSSSSSPTSTHILGMFGCYARDPSNSLTVRYVQRPALT